MADVLVLFKTRDNVPAEVRSEHIEKIRNTTDGRVFWCADETEALEQGIDAEVLFMWGGSGEVPVNWCQKSKKLKWIHTFSAGYNPIMYSPVWQLPVKLTNAKGIHGKTMALTTLGYIVALLREFPRLHNLQLRHQWELIPEKLPRESEGLTVCILGAGAIGSEIARLAQAIGMHVIGVRRNAVPMEYYDEVVPENKRDDAIREADFLIVTVPLTPETRHMVNEHTFEIMKNGSYFINVARGAVMDETALIKALQSGKLAGAALDVTEVEPLDPESPLWDMENVIITPHTSANSEKYVDRAIDQFCENLKLYDQGKSMLNEIKMGV